GGAGAVAADYLQATAGSTGTKTATLSNSAYWAAEQVAIKATSPSSSCSPPSTVTAALGPYSSGSYTCYCDTFNRASVNPSTIFNSSWLLNTSNGSFGVPKIVDPGRLRLTDNTGNNAESAT